jgi:hypothetical protein
MDHGTLSATFIDALEHWKPQKISFLDLPGELRNQIYNHLIPNTNQHYTELKDLDLRGSPTLPPVALMFTCKEIHREVLPIYFRTINLRLRFEMGEYPQAIDRPIHGLHPAVTPLRYYAKLDPSMVDHLHSLRLVYSVIDCDIEITDPKGVHVKLFAYRNWLSPRALTFMSVAIKNKIMNSLLDSPTGLLGVRHFLIAEEEIHQLWEWGEWKQQEDEWDFQKFFEAVEYFQIEEFGGLPDGFEDSLVQAEEECMNQNA